MFAHLRSLFWQGSPYLLRPDLHGSLGEMRLMVFVRSTHAHLVSGCEFKTQTTGLLGGRLPNKGGLVAKFNYKTTSLCFVCTHLEAHEGFGHCASLSVSLSMSLSLAASTVSH